MHHNAPNTRRTLRLALLLCLAPWAACGGAAPMDASSDVSAVAQDDGPDLEVDVDGFAEGELDSEASTARVYGGRATSSDVFPAVGRLLRLNAPYTAGNFVAVSSCTGTLVPRFGSLVPRAGRQLILTAGHCGGSSGTGQAFPASRLIFVLPPNGQRGGPLILGATQVYAQIRWPADSYHPTTDIALIEAQVILGDGPLPKMDSVYRSADLPVLRPGALFYTLGYGMRYSDQAFSSSLRNPLVGAYLTLQRAAGRFWYLLDTTGGTCVGDSGGPVYVKTRAGGRQILGVTSSGPAVPCGVRSDEPSLYARAAPFMYGW